MLPVTISSLPWNENKNLSNSNILPFQVLNRYSNDFLLNAKIKLILSYCQNSRLL